MKKILSCLGIICMLVLSVPADTYAAGVSDTGRGQTVVFSRSGTLSDYFVNVSSTAGIGDINVEEPSVFLSSNMNFAAKRVTYWKFMGWSYSVTHDGNNYSEETIIGTDARYVSSIAQGHAVDVPYEVPEWGIRITRGTRGTVFNPIYYSLWAVYRPMIYTKSYNKLEHGDVTCLAGDDKEYSIPLETVSDGYLTRGYPIPYDERAYLTFTPEPGYEIAYISFEGRDVSLSDKGRLGHTITTEKVVEPKPLEFDFREISYNVKYDGNGADGGSMDDQSFTYTEEKVLAANNYERERYIFKGWNTKADGSGDSYTDGQTVSMLTTEQNGTIVLYAQWEICPQHDFVNNECTKCGWHHTHDYQYSGSGSVITESCEAECGYSETATIEKDDAVATNYTGFNIEALKITYSAGWNGGNLDISYSDNINAGIAKGMIIKDGATASANFEIKKGIAEGVATPTISTITYGKKLSNDMFSDASWEWAEEGLMPLVDNEGYLAYYTPTDTSNYDWSTVDGWDDNLQKVVRTVSVPVEKKQLAKTWEDTENDDNGTETSDSFNAKLWAMIMILSFVVGAYAVLKRRKFTK